MQWLSQCIPLSVQKQATLYFAFRLLHLAGGIISTAAKCAHRNKVATARLTGLSEASTLKTVIFLLFIS
jgi:hypothetical protein